MITHLVFINFHDAADAADIAERLNALQGVVPSLRSMAAGPNVMPSKRAWDLGLVATFEDLDGLDAYRTHPAHVAVLEDIRRLASATASVDFES